MPIDPSATIPPDTPLSKLPNFDPREVPVVGIDAHLPAVSAARLALTAKHRPDLIAAARQAGRLTRGDEEFLARL